MKYTQTGVLIAVFVGVLLAPITARAELILHYSIDTGTVSGGNMQDVSPVQENNALRGGGGSFALVNDRDGNSSSAVSLSGLTGIAVDNANGISTGGSGEFTIAGWFNGTDNGYFFDQESDRLVLSVERNVAGAGVYFGGTWFGTDTTSVNDGSWHHLAYVFDNDSVNSYFSIYLDGVAQDVDPGTGGDQLTRTMTGIIDLSQQGTNFRQRFGSNFSGSGDQLSGSYDDLRIYNTALTAGEIQSLVIPEPGVASLLAAGLLMAGLVARRRQTGIR